MLWGGIIYLFGVVILGLCVEWCAGRLLWAISGGFRVCLLVWGGDVLLYVVLGLTVL